MKVLVTGHRGYIGVHLVDLLKSDGHEVVGCDIGLFDDCEWEPCARADHELVKDVRTLERGDVTGFDCVMHLAAVSNDPMGEVDPELTFGVNRDASIRLAELAREAGVPRYLFSSSCSVYGRQERDLGEDDQLNPLTTYAKSKIDTEEAVGALANDRFTPVFLRNATAYGHSPMLRIDLVANNLLACARASGRIDIMSDGTPWRPLIHCRDIALAFTKFMTAPAAAVHGRAINVGDNRENYQVREIADQVQVLVPDANITYTGEHRDDPRSYRVRFDLLQETVPEFRPAYTLKSGLDELNRKMTEHGFTQDDFDGDQFVRLRTLNRRLDRLELTPSSR